MPSRTYTLFAQAIRGRKQIVCTYGGYLQRLLQQPPPKHFPRHRRRTSAKVELPK